MKVRAAGRTCSGLLSLDTRKTIFPYFQQLRPVVRQTLLKKHAAESDEMGRTALLSQHHGRVLCDRPKGKSLWQHLVVTNFLLVVVGIPLPSEQVFNWKQLASCTPDASRRTNSPRGGGVCCP